MRTNLRGVAMLSAVAAALVLVITVLWHDTARPHTPVPPVVIEKGTAATPRVAMIAPREGLRPLPLNTVGRTASTPDKKGYLQEWPGFHAEGRFTGTGIYLRFQDMSNRWRVTLDGGDGGRIDLARPGATDVRIDGLAPGEHLIRVEKISESSMPASFGGVFIDDSASPLPAPEPAARLIEFIGDSDMVGFANGATSRDCTEEEIFAATDTSASFGPQVAAALGADYRVIARSGIGLLRNYGGASPETTMPSRYPLALPSDPHAAGQPQRPADIVVTGLGSNDFGSDFAPGEVWQDQAALSRDFAPALTEFLRARVRENPQALQVLLAFGEYGDALVGPYRQAEAALKSDGARVVLVVLPKLQRSACLWHPSAQDHRMIARDIIHAIEGAGA